jgi:signal transduction histidine kinase
MATAEGLVRVVVEDSGSGIPEKDLELIFEKFVQGGKIQSHAGGTGLGLAICREIVQAHGGRIWAENRAEGGARIALEMPLAGPPAAAEQDILQPRAGHDEDLLTERIQEGSAAA